MCLPNLFMKNKIEKSFVKQLKDNLLDLTEMTAREKPDTIEIKNTSLKRIYNDEQCFYQGKGSVLERVEFICSQPKDNSLNGLLRRGFKKLFSRSSVERDRYIKVVEQDKYSAMFYITNERLVLMCENNEYSFDLSLDDVMNVEVDGEGVIVYSYDNRWSFFTDDGEYIRDVIELMNICYEEQE